MLIKMKKIMKRLLCLTLTLALFMGNVTVSHAKSLKEQIAEEFAARDMPSQFKTIGVTFTYNADAKSPSRLWSDATFNRPVIYSAKGLCGGKYDDYTYEDTPKRVKTLMKEYLASIGAAMPESVFNSKFLTKGEMFLFTEGQYPVVDYDEETGRYIVWIEGYFNWDMATSPRSCAIAGWNMSNRSGFYAIDKKYVFVDDVAVEQKVPKSIGTGYFTKPYVFLYREATTNSDPYWWANYSVNQKINIVGEKGDFYKVSFKHSRFCRRMRLCYVQKKYVNAVLNGVKAPSAVYEAKIDPKSYSYINIRTAPNLSSTKVGYAYKGTKIGVITRGTDFDTVVFSGQTAYIKSEYLTDYTVTNKYQCKLKPSGKIKVKKIKKNSITYTWPKTRKADAYKVICPSNVKKKQYVSKTNTVTIPLSVINKNVNAYTITVYPAQKLPDGKYTVSKKCIKTRFFKPRPNLYRVKRSGGSLIFTYYKNKRGTQIQYSTNKKFKSAKSFCQKLRTKKGGQVRKTVKISSKKKCYIRARGYIKYKVGKKIYRHYGNWSMVRRIKG